MTARYDLTLSEAANTKQRRRFGCGRTPAPAAIRRWEGWLKLHDRRGAWSPTGSASEGVSRPLLEARLCHGRERRHKLRQTWPRGQSSQRALRSLLPHEVTERHEPTQAARKPPASANGFVPWPRGNPAIARRVRRPLLRPTAEA